MQNKDTAFKFSRYFLILNIIVFVLIAFTSQFAMNFFAGYSGIFSILLMIAATAMGLLDVSSQAEPLINPHYELFVMGGSIVVIYLAALIYAICVVVFEHIKHPRGFLSLILSLICVGGGLFTLYSVFIVSQTIYNEGRLIFH